MFEIDTVLVKERAGLLKMSDTYDLIDPSTATPIGICKEKVAWWVHLLRLSVKARNLPTRVVVSDVSEANPWLEIQRGFSFFGPRVRVVDGQGALLGTFKSKLFSWGINFRILDANDREIAGIKGFAWNFELTESSGKPMGTISKKWAGLGKELFTSADNYMVDVSIAAPESKLVARKMVLAAALAIDICYNE